MNIRLAWSSLLYPINYILFNPHSVRLDSGTIHTKINSYEHDYHHGPIFLGRLELCSEQPVRLLRQVIILHDLDVLILRYLSKSSLRDL